MEAILGGQTIKLDNPNALLGLIDNLMKLRQAKEGEQRQLTERDQLLNTLRSYNIGGGEDRPAQTFREAERRYSGAVDGEPQFKSAAKPQVTNLRQLVDVIQGLKGLPQEYAGSIISRLTGMADPSQEKEVALTKLRASLLEPQQKERLEQRKSEQEQKKSESVAKRASSQQMQLQRLKAGYYQNILKTSLNPKEKEIAAQELMKLLMSSQTSGETAPASVTPSFKATWKESK